MSKYTQHSMFDQTQADLPLFSGTAQKAAASPFKIKPVSKQIPSPFNCLTCRDTGKVDSRRFCWCEAGKKAFGERTQITSPEDTANFLIGQYGSKDQEHFVVITLDTKYYVQEIVTVYIGTVHTIDIRPPDIFRSAIKNNSVAIILCHNHPSGDPTPSPEDVSTTRALVAAGKTLDIEVVDHIIVGHNRYVSLKERSLI